MLIARQSGMLKRRNDYWRQGSDEEIEIKESEENQLHGWRQEDNIHGEAIGMAKLRVTRRAYRRKDGTRVRATAYTITDRGRKGRGPKIIPSMKRGTLDVDFSDSAATRHRQESKVASRVGEKKVVGKLRAIQVLNKRTNPTVSKKARADSRYVAGSFKGKKRVKYPSGFSKR